MRETADIILKRLHEMAKNDAPDSNKKFEIFGMTGLHILNIPHQDLVHLAEETGIPNQPLATALWESDIYEAKILSCLFSDPTAITDELAESWASGITSWVICDYCCARTLWQTPFAKKKAVEWAESNRDNLHIYAGFTLIASLAANLPPHAEGELGFFDNALFLARKQASVVDNDVSRAISSALKQIGMRNRDWHEAAVETCEEIAAQPSEAAKWVASQALAELMASSVLKNLGGSA